MFASLDYFEGWYFGKMAGLLGTMDHEKATDFLSSEGVLESDIAKFAKSWALNPTECRDDRNLAHRATAPSEELLRLCSSLFQSKNSQFSTCFSRVSTNPVPFAESSYKLSDQCSLVMPRAAWAETDNLRFQVLHSESVALAYLTQTKFLISLTVSGDKYSNESGLSFGFPSILMNGARLASPNPCELQSRSLKYAMSMIL